MTGSTNDVNSAALWNPTYGYDAIGNRKSATGAHPVTSYTANEVNQYTAIDTVSRKYDDDGNLTTDGTWTYTWNNENRLKRATDGVTTIHYTYDYGGRLVKRDDGTTAEVYVYDGWNRIATFDGGTLANSYLWGLDLSGSMQGAGGVGGLLKEGSLYPFYDANGNIMQKLNSSGVAVMSVDYDPFGNVISGTLSGDYGFSTKPLDAATSLYYYGYRWYDAANGRWLNRDPIGERGGLNLYGFAHNNALSFVDADGRIIVKMAIATIIGVTILTAIVVNVTMSLLDAGLQQAVQTKVETHLAGGGRSTEVIQIDNMRIINQAITDVATQGFSITSKRGKVWYHCIKGQDGLYTIDIELWTKVVIKEDETGKKTPGKWEKIDKFSIEDRACLCANAK